MRTVAKQEKEELKLLVPANASERQAIQNNILLSRLLAFALLIIVGQLVFHQINPMVIEKPVYIEFRSSSNNFVKVSAAGRDIRANRALVEASIRRYLVDRERVDKVSEIIRYRRVMAMSSDKVGEFFREKYGADDAPFKSEGQKREIDITRAVELVPGIYQLEYTVTDTFSEAQRSFTTKNERGRSNTDSRYYNTKPAQTARWVATIAYEFREQNVTYDEHLMNPIGLFITNFSLSRRKES